MQTTEENALVTRQTETGELQTSSSQASAQHEIQSAIIVAQRIKRDEDASYGKLIKACQRPSFAGDVSYSFRRGESVITGPSIYFAREFARLWGNIRHGVYITHDDEHTRTIRAWAWDLETNAKVESEDTFAKKIFRKNKGWITPDERDLRELTNRRAAIAKRNCILELLPSDMVEDAIAESEKTLTNKAAQDPDAARKAVVKAFMGISVPVDQLAAYLGHPIGQASPAQIVELRRIYKSIADGNSTWADYLASSTASGNGEGKASAESKLRKEPKAEANGGPTPEAKGAAKETAKDAAKSEEKSTANGEPSPEAILVRIINAFDNAKSIGELQLAYRTARADQEALGDERWQRAVTVFVQNEGRLLGKVAGESASAGPSLDEKQAIERNDIAGSIREKMKAAKSTRGLMPVGDEIEKQKEFLGEELTAALNEEFQAAYSGMKR